MKITWAAARVNAGYKQPQTAEYMGVSVNTIIDWEKYRKHPDVAQAEKLCKFYGCTMQDILLA